MTDKDIEIIVKPIFTKMFDFNFSACEYGIECYKKGMEYQGIKELAIENENLIKRVRKLETQIEKMKCCGNCMHCYEGSYHNGYRCKDHAKESVCDNWEMMPEEERKMLLADD